MNLSFSQGQFTNALVTSLDPLCFCLDDCWMVELLCSSLCDLGSKANWHLNLDDWKVEMTHSTSLSLKPWIQRDYPGSFMVLSRNTWLIKSSFYSKYPATITLFFQLCWVLKWLHLGLSLIPRAPFTLQTIAIWFLPYHFIETALANDNTFKIVNVNGYIYPFLFFFLLYCFRRYCYILLL